MGFATRMAALGDSGIPFHMLAFVSKADPSHSKLGLPTARMQAVAAPIQRLRSLCHELKIPVFFTRMGFAEDYSDCGLLLTKPPYAKIRDLRGFIRGSWDFDVLDELKPDPSIDIMVDKTRQSAFWNTNLTELLVENKVDQLIVVGVGSNICVESTVRDAFSGDWHAVTVRDATQTLTDELHNASMNNLDAFGGTSTVEEIEKALRKMSG